jgi:hypothetical protein
LDVKQIEAEVEAERERLFTLFRRMIALGALLPGHGDEIELAAALDDPDTRADAVMIIREMEAVRAAVDTEIAAIRARRLRQEAVAKVEKRRK